LSIRRERGGTQSGVLAVTPLTPSKILFKIPVRNRFLPREAPVHTVEQFASDVCVSAAHLPARA